MSFQNTIKCMNKFNMIQKPIVSSLADSRKSLTLSDNPIWTEDIQKLNKKITEMVSEFAEPDVEDGIAIEIYSPRKSLDLDLIKTKKLELEKSIKNYKRPEKPGKPKKVINSKIANKKLEK